MGISAAAEAGQGTCTIGGIVQANHLHCVYQQPQLNRRQENVPKPCCQRRCTQREPEKLVLGCRNATLTAKLSVLPTIVQPRERGCHDADRSGKERQCGLPLTQTEIKIHNLESFREEIDQSERGSIHNSHQKDYRLGNQKLQRSEQTNLEPGLEVRDVVRIGCFERPIAKLFACLAYFLLQKLSWSRLAYEEK